MTTHKRPVSFQSDPRVTPAPLPFGTALLRGAALALALGVGAAGCSDSTEPPPSQTDLGTDAPPPVDLGADLGPQVDLGPPPPPRDMGPDVDLGRIPPRPPLTDLGIGRIDLGGLPPEPPPPIPWPSPRAE